MSKKGMSLEEAFKVLNGKTKLKEAVVKNYNVRLNDYSKDVEVVEYAVNDPEFDELVDAFVDADGDYYVIESDHLPVNIVDEANEDGDRPVIKKYFLVNGDARIVGIEAETPNMYNSRYFTLTSNSMPAYYVEGQDFGEMLVSIAAFQDSLDNDIYDVEDLFVKTYQA